MIVHTWSIHYVGKPSRGRDSWGVWPVVTICVRECCDAVHLGFHWAISPLFDWPIPTIDAIAPGAWGCGVFIVAQSGPFSIQAEVVFQASSQVQGYSRTVVLHPVISMVGCGGYTMFDQISGCCVVAMLVCLHPVGCVQQSWLW